jgi:hypothetical protein
VIFELSDIIRGGLAAHDLTFGEIGETAIQWFRQIQQEFYSMWAK